MAAGANPEPPAPGADAADTTPASDTSPTTTTIPTTDTTPAADTAPAAPRRGLLPDGTLDPRNNSLNVIRLVLAWSVLVSHAYPISGNGDGPGWKGENLGGWAVIGFFVVSGYLITGSRRSNTAGHYFVNRVARIFPAFLVCLVVIAFGFAPWEHARQHGSLDGFWTTGTTPFTFVFDNALLDMVHYDVAGGPTVTPYKGAWNGSLWSLWFEFVCYIVVGLLLALPYARRRAWPVVVLFALSVVLWANQPQVAPYFDGYHQKFLMKLLPYFLGGAAVAMLKRRLPLRAWAGVASLLVAVGIVWVVPAWGGQLASPLFAYGILWLASAVPCPRLLQRHDISYGVYVYAWPCTVAAYALGFAAGGMLPLVVATSIGTVACATLSWVLVERPAMRAARGQRPFGA